MSSTLNLTWNDYLPVVGMFLRQRNPKVAMSFFVRKYFLNSAPTPTWHNWWLTGDKLVTSDPVITSFLLYKFACTTGDKLVINWWPVHNWWRSPVRPAGPLVWPMRGKSQWSISFMQSMTTMASNLSLFVQNGDLVYSLEFSEIMYFGGQTM